MLYQDNGQWKPNLKKINYKMQHEAYDIDTFAYLNNPKFEEVTIEDVVLTSDQLTRLEKVKALDTSIKDIEDYVINGVINQSNEILKRVVEDATLRELVAKYVPQTELTKASISFEEATYGEL